jgi:hypothetical protein
MNNVNSSQSLLKIQEKYFLKYENTYFLDKKCSEAWLNNYYIPGTLFFKNREFNNLANPSEVKNLYN